MQNETKRATTPIDIQISEINDAKYIGVRVRFEALVNDLEEIPFVPPAELRMDCEPDPEIHNPCKKCNHVDKSTATHHLDAEDPNILKFINCKDGDIWKLYKQIMFVPSRCDRAKFKEEKRVNLVRGSLVPTVEYVDTDDDGNQVENVYNIIVETIFIGKDLVQANRSYRLEGIPHRDPKNGSLVLVVDKAEGIMDDINSFKLSEGMIKALKLFQPKEWTKASLVEKVSDIHKEMRINHHKINGRENSAFFIDLAYHSVMGFEWGHTTHLRGWLQLCICGDTSVGKSEMLERLMKMHQMGYIIPGESVSYAGLMGGVVNQNNKRNGNILHWGVLPKHHRRIVIFDEAHHENAVKIWPMLNDVNSSGIAKYNKIIQRQTPAQVRKIFSSNPPTGTSVSDYLYPCEMMKPIYTSPETIRRFDALVVPTRLDVDPSLISREEPTIEPYYYGHWGYAGENGFDQKSPGYWLLRYIYSRTPKQVVFEEDARQLVISESDRMCNKYSDHGIPLVEPGGIRFKLARGCASLAARTFSVNEFFDTIIIRKCHVEVYIEALEAQYDGTTGYLGYSKKMFKQTKFANAEAFWVACGNVKQAFMKQANQPLLRQIHETDQINFKEMGYTWSVGPEVMRNISTAMLSHGLVTPNMSMTSYRKNRKALLVLGYLQNVDLGLMLSHDSCINYFKSHT